MGDAIGDRHVRQVMAVLKSPAANASDIIANYYARQTTAVLEGHVPNAHDAFWYRHALQTTAAPEGILPNARNAVWYRHARQTTAVTEGKPPNARNAVWYRHARQTTTRVEGITSNGNHRFSIVTEWNHQCSRCTFIAVCNGDAVAFSKVVQRIPKSQRRHKKNAKKNKTDSSNEFHYAFKSYQRCGEVAR